MVQLNITEADFIHEEEILRNPHSVKSWLRYIEHKQEDGDFGALNMIYERALKQLPGSYKLWYKYLRERRRQCKARDGHLSKIFRILIGILIEDIQPIFSSDSKLFFDSICNI